MYNLLNQHNLENVAYLKKSMGGIKKCINSLAENLFFINKLTDLFIINMSTISGCATQGSAPAPLVEG